MWDIAFAEMDENGKPIIAATGGGNELKVFAFVADCIRKLIDKKHPKYLYFTADASEPARVKLYDRLAKKLEVKYDLTKGAAKKSGKELVEYYFKAK
jgi:hypothetical protein